MTLLGNIMIEFYQEKLRKIREEIRKNLDENKPIIFLIRERNKLCFQLAKIQAAERDGIDVD